jgi:pre-mRNA-splicing factor 38A
MELREIGGSYGGNNKATPFLCLVLKMLQLVPKKEIAIEYINAEEFKYESRFFQPTFIT